MYRKRQRLNKLERLVKEARLRVSNPAKVSKKHCRFCKRMFDVRGLSKHEDSCEKGPAVKITLLSNSQRKRAREFVKLGNGPRVSTDVDLTKTFNEQMVDWSGWKVLSKDLERNVLIVQVPLV